MIEKNSGQTPALWLTEEETALRLNMSRKWLQKKRLSGDGIPFAKFGSAVRYSRAEVEKYEAACTRVSTSDEGEGRD